MRICLFPVMCILVSSGCFLKRPNAPATVRGLERTVAICFEPGIADSLIGHIGKDVENWTYGEIRLVRKFCKSLEYRKLRIAQERARRMEALRRKIMLLVEGTASDKPRDVALWRKVFEVELTEQDIDRIIQFTSSRTGRKWMLAVTGAFARSFVEDVRQLGDDVKRILGGDTPERE